jgi:glutamine amidotransferase
VIALVDYGAGNLRSVEFALDRLGVPHRRAPDADGLRDASGAVLPGVGAAESAMGELRARSLVEPLRSLDAPLLGVCLGMQLLTESSDEGEAEVEGLGRIPGRTRRFAGDVRLPQIGWNRVRLRSDEPLFRGLGGEAWFYFLHGHRVVCEEGDVTGRARYGEPFPAAIRRGEVAGVQFHPEKSGAAGLRVLANFCAGCGEETRAP